MAVTSHVQPPVAWIAAQRCDVDHLVSIRIEAMRESLQRIGRFDPERARDRFISGFRADCTWHIEVSGERVGFVVLKPEAQALVLDHLYVKPTAQGAGVGAAVLSEVFKRADASGLPVNVGALKESASNRFYLRHGFQYVESGEFDNYYVRPCSRVMGSEVRLACHDDATAIRQVIVAALRTSNAQDYPPDVINLVEQSFSLQAVLQFLTLRQVYVATIDHQIVGTASLDGDVVRSVFVDPDHQGVGIGRQLMSRIVSAAANASVNLLRVPSSITAEGFYFSVGFRKVRDEFQGAERTVIMALRLG